MLKQYFIPDWLIDEVQSPLIADGTIHGMYNYEEQAVHITFMVGTKTHIPTGEWAFGIPDEYGAVAALGYSKAIQMGRQQFHGYAAFDPMTRLAMPIFPGRAGDSYSHYVVERYRPFTWGPGDKLRISLNKI